MKKSFMLIAVLNSVLSFSTQAASGYTSLLCSKGTVMYQNLDNKAYITYTDLETGKSHNYAYGLGTSRNAMENGKIVTQQAASDGKDKVAVITFDSEMLAKDQVYFYATGGEPQLCVITDSLLE